MSDDKRKRFGFASQGGRWHDPTDWPTVGENGPELRTLPAGTHIYSAEITRGFLAEYLDGDPIDLPHPDDHESEQQ